LGEEEEVLHMMEDGQTHPNVCRSINLPPLTVGTLMKNADKIIESMQLQEKVSYSCSKFLEKMEKLLSSSWVDFFNQIY